MTTRPGERHDFPVDTVVEVTSSGTESNGPVNVTTVPRVSFSQDVVNGVGKLAKSDSWVYMDGEVSPTARNKRMMSLCR
jgi:hypothetical protein